MKKTALITTGSLHKTTDHTAGLLLLSRKMCGLINVHYSAHVKEPLATRLVPESISQKIVSNAESVSLTLKETKLLTL